MLESLLNKFICLQACNFTRKRLHHRRFPVNIANFKDTYFEKHMRTAGFDSSYIMHRKSNKIIQEADWPSRLDYFFQNIKSPCFSYSRSYYFVLSLVVIRCHSMPCFDTRHFLSLAVPLVVTRCITHCYSLSCSMSFIVTRCHSLYHLLLFIVSRCHSMSLDVPLACLFINDNLFMIFCFLHHL